MTPNKKNKKQASFAGMMKGCKKCGKTKAKSQPFWLNKFRKKKKTNESFDDAVNRVLAETYNIKLQ